MSVLPASVRVALWASAAYGGAIPVVETMAHALPDVDHVTGDVGRLGLWHELGERVVLTALPYSGDLTGMPRSSPELVAAAVAVGECVFVPGLGGALVPELTAYGPAGDRGVQVRWAAYEAEPVPVHVIDALSLSELELGFRHELMELTRQLDALDARPWAGDPSRAVADERLASGRWGLPDGMPRRAVSVLTMAARASTAAEVGLRVPSPALTGDVDARRQVLLTRLRHRADATVAAAANVAALHLAGLRRP